MNVRFTVVVLALCGLGACSSGGDTPARDSREQGSVGADSAALALVEEYLKERPRALEEPGRRERARAVGDSCQEAAVVADSAALALVEEYLKRDARGEFTGVSEWLREVTYHGGGEWDGMAVASGYEIVAAETRCDTTRVTVHWDVVGGVSTPGPTLEPKWTLTDSVDVWTFMVLSTEEGPRLTGELIYPHMSARVILERNFADEEYRRALEEALRRKAG